MGLLFSVIDQNYPPKAKWSVNDIPDLSSKITIVTGGSSGLGYETAKALLSHNATVYLACRDSKKTTSVIEKLKQETGKTAIFLELDLASLGSVKNAAEIFKTGVMCPPMEQLTKEGYDLQFGTNVLGHFYFTSLLLPELKAGAQTSSPDRVSRVIHTSSQIHVLAKLNYETFIDSQARRKLGLNGLYGQSKFGNIVFSNELARRHGKDGITSIAVHPDISHRSFEE
ncbi:hypothetical protein Clacol_007115 [Clathrus columnatus]|uniref:NAD(P)-binding protein n=1 Tax=Clathrus columnatus TaxID=1419009 RepID=A0AAV5AE12_9AGAM|nr:hypothetical protein Clacol_007115 [Clathrus columnatus]